MKGLQLRKYEQREKWGLFLMKMERIKKGGIG